MSKLKNKLDYLNKDKSGIDKTQHQGAKNQRIVDKDQIKKRWESIDSGENLSTKDKLAKLVNLSLKRKDKEPVTKAVPVTGAAVECSSAYIIRDFSYPLEAAYGKFPLTEWLQVDSESLAIITGEEEFLKVSPQKLLFFDTETTGLSGGTGTIPFMLGFGFFDITQADERNAGVFTVKIFILNDLSKEDEFLESVDRFLGEHDFSATVTYNGKTFDFPLMETRYILQRKRFPLLKLPHLDFLYPARLLWKNTYASRKLGYLGDVLLGLSRDDDVDGSQIPMIYFNYIRSRAFSLIQKVVEHNSLDLVGLAGLLMLGIKYLEDVSHTFDEGEILGTAKLYERYGNFEKADELYKIIKQSASRDEIIEKAVKGLSILLKKKKCYKEAAELWELLSTGSDHYSVKELSMHFEHREKDYVKALALVRTGLENLDLTGAQRVDFEKRYKRLSKKIKAFEKEE
ncbi:MAG: hypothetical protein GY757_10240 [bacterium]|nr:hypothetical protein [bacterium]